ncbi:MAG: FHA domain-containing protein [Chloroflexota bacterium]|nr:MAG: FHA domain-containing protein [Chloroflexota bacterium]
MRRCSECGEDYLDGALFCGECGAGLLQERNISQASNMPVPEVVGGEAPTRPLDYRLGFGIKADRIIFVIPSTGRRMKVDLGRDISIGRVDSRRGIWPEVDLTMDQGVDGGVSRMHALVRNSDEGVFLVDLGSTNGTRINNKQLPPERPYLLSNGDSVRFGQLLVEIYFAA